MEKPSIADVDLGGFYESLADVGMIWLKATREKMPVDNVECFLDGMVGNPDKPLRTGNMDGTSCASSKISGPCS